MSRMEKVNRNNALVHQLKKKLAEQSRLVALIKMEEKKLKKVKA